MDNQKADLLYGVPAIAQYLGLTDRQVYHLVSKNEIPSFKIGAKVCARKSDIDTFIDALADASIRKAGKTELDQWLAENPNYSGGENNG